MKIKSQSYAIIVALAVAVLVLPGCATLQKRKVQKSGFLNDYSRLTEGGKGEAQLRWIDSKTDFSKYDSIILDPIMMYGNPGTKVQKLTKEEQQALVDYFHAALRKELTMRGFKVVSEPGPTTMRGRFAFTDAQAGRPVLNTVSTIIPISLAVSTAKKIVTDRPLAVGQASIEMEMLDSTTGTRIGAAVDSRVGTKMPSMKQFSRWKDVEASCDSWAETLATRLAELKQRL